jgi:hypothetical protein
MQNSPDPVGRLVGVVLFACLAAYFLIRGLARGPRSLRLANLSLFCGLTAFVMPEIASGLSPSTRPGLFLASGAVRVLLGLAGIALAVAALVTRRDGGTGIVRPITGAGFSVLHALAGAGLVVFAVLVQPSSPWVFQPPDGAYRLTLPSQQWKQSASTGGVGIVAFVRPFPHMQASVLSAKQDQDEADFVFAAKAFRRRIYGNPRLREGPKFREGTNAFGNPYRYCTATETGSDGKPVFVAHSVTWCPQKRMVLAVIFEGSPRMLSEAGKAAEAEAIEKSAETICLSVE